MTLCEGEDWNEAAGEETAAWRRKLIVRKHSPQAASSACRRIAVSFARRASSAIVLIICCSCGAAASPRIWQPLVIKGSQFRKLLGRNESSIELLAIHGGKLQPIPFQIDNIRNDGRYALPEGPSAISDNGDGRFEARDELVLMVKDLGSRAETPVRPVDADEIEVSDPLGGAPRYAYADSVPHPRRSPVHYLDYDDSRDRMETSFYRVGLTHGWPEDFALQHGTDAQAPNLIDRFKVRTSARLLGFFTWHMNEDDIDSRLIAWKLGPVRMIRMERHSVRLLFGIRSPQVVSTTFVYRNEMDNPTTVSFPWLPRLVLNHVVVRAYVDYRSLDGFTLAWSGMNQPPMVIGGNSVEERKLSDGAIDPSPQWIALRGAGRLMIQTFAPSPALNKIERNLFYRDSDKPDPPEKYPGDHPGVGYVTTGYRNLGGGKNTVDSLMVIAPASYEPQALMREISAAPHVTIDPASR